MTTTSQADLGTNTNAFMNGAAGSVVGGGTMAANVANKILNIDNSGSYTNNILNNTNPNTGGGGSVANQRAADNTGKRKKFKSRNAPMPNSGYSKDHLDAWLETCLRDASNTQLSSSSEFLDYNPTGMQPRVTSNTNKNMSAQQQQQQQQQQSAFVQSFIPNQQAFSNPHQQQQKQQQFAMRTNSQPQMTYPNSGYTVPFSQGFQRNLPNVTKQSNAFNNRFSNMFSQGSSSGGGYYPPNNGSQDFASLPPLVNMMGGSSEHENNSTDVLDGSGSNPNISRGFRFSDPCLLNPSDNDSKISGQNTPDRRNNIPTDLENNKFFAALMEQINMLHETNSKICRNLHETKVDIEALKHAPTWGIRHRRDSLSGLSTHSQPMVFGGGFGTQSPAPTYHSGAYTPGMMTDVVREVKEAARVREDALLNRVKAMVEERQWSMNECNLRIMRDIEELKSQIHHLRTDRKEANKRINHLEAENKYMRQMLASIFNNRNAAPDIIYENEALRTRKSYPNARRSQSLSLHYGTIHHQPESPSNSVEEEQEQQEPLHIVETPSTNSTVDSASATHTQRHPSDISITTSTPIHNGSISHTAGQTNLSPPTFAIISSPLDDALKRKKEKPTSKRNAEESQVAQQSSTSSTQELRRELNEAVAARQEADDRIIALEKLVKSLRVNSTHPTEALANGDGTNVIGGCSDDFTNTAYKWAHQTPSSTSSQFVHNSTHHQAHTTASSSVNIVAHSPPKLSVAGPITDL